MSGFGTSGNLDVGHWLPERSSFSRVTETSNKPETYIIISMLKEVLVSRIVHTCPLSRLGCVKRMNR